VFVPVATPAVAEAAARPPAAAVARAAGSEQENLQGEIAYLRM